MRRLVLLLALAAVPVAAARAAGTAAEPAMIATVAGTGVAGWSGDGGSAQAAEIDHPRGLALAPGGGYAFADAFAHVVRRVWPDGHITTVAGTGIAGFSGDGGPAAQAELDLPHGVAFARDGTLLIADTLNNRIRAVAADGTISTVAGTGTPGFAGDGGPAALAEISAPRGITALPGGGFVFPDSDNNRVREVSAEGTITTVAGSGTPGFDGDGGPATAAALDRPFAVVPAAGGGLLIADTGNDRIRRVAPDGTIATVAGDGVRGYGGDGGPAVAAAISSPHNLAALVDGGVLVADEGNNRVRRVLPDGTITTIAGTGEAGFSGDDGPASAAALDQPKALAVLPNLRGFLLADAANSRIRLVSVDLRRDPGLRLVTRSLRIRKGHQAALVFTVADPVTTRLEVRAGRRVVLRLASRAAQGRHTTRFGRGLAAGSYTVTVRVWSGLDLATTVTAVLRVTA